VQLPAGVDFMNKEGTNFWIFTNIFAEKIGAKYGIFDSNTAM
jgi:hypothetical protein